MIAFIAALFLFNVFATIWFLTGMLRHRGEVIHRVGQKK
jgi:uncharacterized membrane protein